jgi:hypothetical protein
MSIPFFNDFNKKTKDFYDKEQYDFGQQFHFKNATKDAQFKAKVTTGAKVGAKLTITTTPSWGSIELNEDIHKGLSLEVKVPNIYRGISLIGKYGNNELEITKEWRPNSFLAFKLKGLHNPDRNGQRICDTTISGTCGDDSMHLNVGGEIIFRDEGAAGLSQYNIPKLLNYSTGFLYEPTKDSSYSLIFKPDAQSIGMDYNLSTLYNINSINATISSNIMGKVDTKITSTPPIISFAGGFNWGLRYLQLMFNSNKEYGIQYKFNVNDFIMVQFGLACLLDSNQQRRNHTFGYKISIS